MQCHESSICRELAGVRSLAGVGDPSVAEVFWSAVPSLAGGVRPRRKSIMREMSGCINCMASVVLFGMD